VHKHQLDAAGRWLKLTEYTAPSGGEWDNPFVLQGDQQARAWGAAATAAAAAGAGHRNAGLLRVLWVGLSCCCCFCRLPSAPPPVLCPHEMAMAPISDALERHLFWVVP
jgi:hypothetical protein